MSIKYTLEPQGLWMMADDKAGLVMSKEEIVEAYKASKVSGQPTTSRERTEQVMQRTREIAEARQPVPHDTINQVYNLHALAASDQPDESTTVVVAKAIGHAIEQDGGFQTAQWSELNGHYQKHLLCLAEAAIAAMPKRELSIETFTLPFEIRTKGHTYPIGTSLKVIVKHLENYRDAANSRYDN